MKKWRDENRQHIREYRKHSKTRERKKEWLEEWLSKNPDYFKLYSRAWRAKNRIRYALREHRRRAMKRSSEVAVTKEQIESLAELQRYKCSTCKKSIRNGFHIDHVLALILGGCHAIENLQLLCPKCNMRKGRKTPEQWAAENGLLF